MNDEIKFEEHDVVGEATLIAISQAHKLNKWMYNTIRPFCKGKVLEIGSGIGNISSYFLSDNYEILLTDIRKGYCSKLEETFKGNQNFLGTEVMDLIDPEFDIKHKKYFEQFDTVFALNVVEHIKDDNLALQNCYKLLKKNGHLIILVPSYQFLFNQFDTQLGHYRRYTKSKLLKVFQSGNFDIIHKQHFNFMGIFGWFVTGSIMKKESIPSGQMKFYNMLVPIFKVIDKIIFNSIGLSTIMVGRKSK